MISIVIPVYNRSENLRLALTALQVQTDQRFDVIVSDDGSDEDTLAVLKKFAGIFPIKYCWMPHDRFRAGRARNMGVTLATGQWVLFIDSDILLNPTAIGHYINIATANCDVIVGGRYDWLVPMVITPSDVINRWKELITGTLPPKGTARKLEGIIGADPRSLAVDERTGTSTSPFNSMVVRFSHYCLSLFSGNLLVPRRIYWELGGFDEAMVGHGGEDCEFSIRAEEHHLPVIFAEEVVGYHLYHERNQEQNLREVTANIEYIKAHHDLAALGIGSGKPGQLPLVVKPDEPANTQTA